MKFKRIMLITLLLLAILTIGAVSASDEISDENLTVSEETDMIQASDSDDLSSQDDVEEFLTEEREEVSYYITIPESVRSGDSVEYEDEYPSISYEFYFSDVTGNFSILIDNKTYYTAQLTESWNVQQHEFALNKLNLTYGTHFVQVKYSGDEKYLPFNKTGYFDYYYMKVEVPDPVTIDYNQQIMAYFTLNATGTLKVWIDNREFETIDVYERRYNEYDGSLTSYINIDLSGYDNLTLGNHSYKITYTGGNYPDKIFEGNFTVDYCFMVENWSLENNVIFILGEKIEVYIRLPDTTGTLVLTLNGNEYPIEITNDVFEYILPELEYGQNTLIFTYTHSVYPQRQIIYNLNTSCEIAKGHSGDVIYNAGINNYTLVLPKNASGNLSIYKPGNWSNEILNNELGDLIKTAKLVDGRASLGVDDLSLGYHSVIVIYTGEDYEILRFYDSFIIYPNVIYSDIIYSESEDNNVVVKLPEDAEGNLTISIYEAISGGDDYVRGDLIQQLYNGSAQATVTQTIPKLEAGNYFMTADYCGAEQSAKDKLYFFTVRDENPQWEMIFSIPQELELDFEDEIYMIPSNCPDKFDGVFVLYIDDIPKAKAFSVYDAYYDYSRLTVGEHTWRLEFVNDTYYSPTSQSGTFKFIKNYNDNYVSIYGLYCNDPNCCFAEIFIPDDASGNVKIIVDGTTVFNGSIDKFDYNNDDMCFRVTAGSVEYDWQEKIYTITVIYEGVDYAAFNNTETVEATFDESLEDIYFRIYDLKYNKDDDYFIEICGPDNASGNVKIFADGTNIFNGSISEFDYNYDDMCFRVTVGNVEYDWQEKSYDITVIYEGEDYGKFTKTGTVESSYQYDVFINLFDSIDKYEMEYEPIAYINAPSGAEGNIIVKINGQQCYNKSLVGNDGNGLEIYLTDLSKEFDYGTYDIEILYDGDDYESNNPKSKLEITYLFYGFIENGYADEGTFELDYGMKYYFEVQLPEDATGKLAVRFNGKTSSVAIDESHGKYSIDTTGLKIGEYTIYAIYTKDSKYPDKTISLDFSVIPKLSAPWDISSNEQDSFTVSVPKDLTGTLTLYEAVYDKNGYIYTKISSADVKNGKASIRMPKITRDTTYLLEFNSTSYSKSVLSTVNVYKNSPEFKVTVTPKDLYLKEKLQISITSSVKGAFIIYVDDGEEQYVQLVKGSASKIINGLSAGVHKINIKFIDEYETDKFYSNTFYVTVKNSVKPVPPVKKVTLTLKKVKVKRSAKRLILTAVLKINGKWAKNKKIIFKFNGKKYVAKTNKKGVAKFTIKKKILKKLKRGRKIRYQASYGKITKRYTVKVAR